MSVDLKNMVKRLQEEKFNRMKEEEMRKKAYAEAKLEIEQGIVASGKNVRFEAD